MSLALSPEVLQAAYEYLLTTEPFCSWNLPAGEDVQFRVVRSRRVCGWWSRKNGRHVIAISEAIIKTSHSLLTTMAHEAIHIHETEACTAARGIEHNTAFSLFADEVCKIHGFDRGLF